MESGSKTDLEWKFDVDFTCVRNFKELVGLIVISHVIPNLNSKLDDNEKKFVEACYNVCGFKKDYDWAKVIKQHKEDRSLSLTGNVYNGVSDEFNQTPFEKLLEVMKENNFTWDKIFDMIKKLDSYCYIDFTDNFFDFKDLAQALKEKLKQEKAFDSFKEDWKKNREATMTNNRKNWIKKVNLEEKKIIKSWDDLNQILTKVRKYRDNMLFLSTDETEIISNDYQLMQGNAFDFFVNCYKYEYDKTFTDIESRKCILELLLDLGFSFDYEKFDDHIHKRYESKKNFKELILSFNRQHWLHECILWFNNRDKKIDFSMLGFSKDADKIYPIDNKYDRGFSEEDMSYVLDKFKNEEKGFCCAENMQFFVYMMCNPCQDKFRVMKEKEKRKQFYLDLMDVFAKYVSSLLDMDAKKACFYSKPINYTLYFKLICDCQETYLKEEQVDHFMQEAEKQGVKKDPIKILSYRRGTIPNREFDLLDLPIDLKSKNRDQITFTGCFIDIIGMIPKDIFENGVVKQKIKEVLETMYNVSLYTDKRKAFMLILFIYENYDLCPSKEDIEQLFKKFINYSYNKAYLFCFYFMFNIIFKNRDKFSLDEKKKMLGNLMKFGADKTGEFFFRDEKDLEREAKLKEKTIKIQKILTGHLYRKRLKLKEEKDKTIKLQTAVRKFWAKRKLEQLKRQEKLKSLVSKTLNRQKEIEKAKYFKCYLDQVKKLKLNAIKEKHSMIKITRVAKQFLTRKRKMTKTCKWLFAGFVVSLVTFMFEMFVFDVAFLSIPSILTLLVAIILTAIFLYIDHKFKIFFWKRKPPIENIIDPSIQKENLIFNDKNNLITNQRIGTIPFNPNSITNPINITENNQDSNQKPREEKNIEEENIIDTTETRSNQINLDG